VVQREGTAVPKNTETYVSIAHRC